MTKLEIKTKESQSFTDITDKINALIKESETENGICVLWVPHTTAGITVSENADPDVLADMYLTYNKNFPKRREYLHAEGNSDAHFKSIITGPSLTCIIENGKLALGIWQAIYFCEFDGPRTRKVFIEIISR